MFGFWCLIEMKISDNQTSRPLCITNAKHAAPGSRLPAPGYLAPAANPRERRKPRPSILHFALHARKKKTPLGASFIFGLVRLERFELSRVFPLPPEDSASASSATTAWQRSRRLTSFHFLRADISSISVVYHHFLWCGW